MFPATGSMGHCGREARRLPIETFAPFRNAPTGGGKLIPLSLQPFSFAPHVSQFLVYALGVRSDLLAGGADLRRSEQPLLRRRVVQPQQIAVGFQVQSQHLARQPALHQPDRPVASGRQPQPLQPWLKVVVQGVEQEILLHAENILVDPVLVDLVLVPRPFRCDLDDHIRPATFFPDEVVAAHRFLGQAADDEDVWRQKAVAPALLVVENQRAGDEHHRVGGEPDLQRFEQVKHVFDMARRFADRPAVVFDVIGQPPPLCQLLEADFELHSTPQHFMYALANTTRPSDGLHVAPHWPASPLRAAVMLR